LSKPSRKNKNPSIATTKAATHIKGFTITPIEVFAESCRGTEPLNNRRPMTMKSKEYIQSLSPPLMKLFFDVFKRNRCLKSNFRFKVGVEVDKLFLELTVAPIVEGTRQFARKKKKKAKMSFIFACFKELKRRQFQ
jgi:hypothetical protein